VEPFHRHHGIVAPLWRSNIDTDQIVPKQFLTSTTRTGFGRALFHGWRTRPDGTADEQFPLNEARYADASILVAGRNFGCGSSREHAAWALMDAGFRAVIAPSFADIFLGNAVNNGLAPVVLPADVVAGIVQRADATPGYGLTIDLDAVLVTDAAGFEAPFAIDAAARDRLLQGLDPIAVILRHRGAIAAFERRHVDIS
jgi:3-isopropylmalate/(R)-2-methylmalate dehydratase small subunit